MVTQVKPQLFNTRLYPYSLKIRGCWRPSLTEASVRLSHIDRYAPEDSLSCRLPESSMILGRYPYSLKIRGCWQPSLTEASVRPSHIDRYAPEDSLSCRLPESSMILGRYSINVKRAAAAALGLSADACQAHQAYIRSNIFSKAGVFSIFTGWICSRLVISRAEIIPRIWWLSRSITTQ